MYLHIVELLSKRSFYLCWRGGNSKLRQHTTTGDRNSESPMSASHRTSRRTYRCSRSCCFAAGAAAARRARRASDGGDDGGDTRGLTTTTVDARISPMPNSRTTRETSLPPPSLGISQGAPPSRRGGEEAEEGWDAPLAPPAGCCDASRRAAGRRCLLSSRRSAASCPLTPPLPFVLYAPPPVASCLPAGCRVAPVVAPPPTPPRDFASTSSSPSGCCNLQRPTCRAAAASCLATRRLRLSTRRRLITGCVVTRHRCAGIFAVIAIAIVALVARCRPGVVDVDIRRQSRRRRIPLHRRHRRRLRRPSRRHNRCRLCRPSCHRNRRRCRRTLLLCHHRQRRRPLRCRHRDEGNNAIATTAKYVESSKSS